VGSARGTSDRLLLGACLLALGVLAWLCVARHAPALARARLVVPDAVRPPPQVLPLRAEPPPPLPLPTPAPAPLRVQAEFDRLLASGRIEFETGSDRLRPDAGPLLDAVAETLASAPGLEVEVEAHTDSRGDPGANRRLSQRRAQVVKDYLASKGIAPQRIHTLGSGSTRPLVRTRTREADQLNRRIEFRVLAPGSR
jgi:outer membrane protein OmpA-like peptidoglycan-associated protein